MKLVNCLVDVIRNWFLSIADISNQRITPLTKTCHHAESHGTRWLGQFFSCVTWMTQSATDDVDSRSQDLYLEVWNQLSTSFKCILLNLANLKLFIPWTRLLLYMLSSTYCVTNLNVNIFKWKCFDAKLNHLKTFKCLVCKWYFGGKK